MTYTVAFSEYDLELLDDALRELEIFGDDEYRRKWASRTRVEIAELKKRQDA
jgi:hypothetical protein